MPQVEKGPGSLRVPGPLAGEGKHKRHCRGERINIFIKKA
jgi:hypothetical protein